MIKTILMSALSFACFAMTGCISMPESERELAEGRAEALQFEGIDYSDVEIELPEYVPENIPQFKTLEELYKDFDFNPDGHTLYVAAINDPFGALYARTIKDESIALTSKIYPNKEAVDNDADAFRHAYFSFRLSQKIGAQRAKKFTDAYEISNLNKMGGRCMDLWNNREGRRMYEQTKKIKTDDKRLLAEKNVLSAIKENRLMLEPLKIRSRKKAEKP